MKDKSLKYEPIHVCMLEPMKDKRQSANLYFHVKLFNSVVKLFSF